MTLRYVLAAVLLVGAGCGTTQPDRPAAPSQSVVVSPSPVPHSSFWTRARLLAARGVSGSDEPAKVARTASAAPRVGALFFHDVRGGHFCTASVVGSPSNNLLITAAHCVHGGKGQGYRQDLVFVPSYRDGQTPYGVWQTRDLIVDERWIASSDPDADVAFVVLRDNGGTDIADVLGANTLAVDQPTDLRVRVTGYPSTSAEPVTCANRMRSRSATQLEFDCAGYPDGTSGSPWIANFDQRTHTGQVVGVIGGYEQGGDTPDVSYSPYLGADVERLYQRAVAAG